MFLSTLAPTLPPKKPISGYTTFMNFGFFLEINRVWAVLTLCQCQCTLVTNTVMHFFTLSPKIYLFGHDIYSSTKTVNNLYKDTNGYVGKNAKAIDPKNWIKHYKAIYDRFNDIQFKVVNTEKIKEWDCKNVSYISLEEFNDDLKHNKG